MSTTFTLQELKEKSISGSELVGGFYIEQLSVDEYKELALFMLEHIAAQKILMKSEPKTDLGWIAHRTSKAIFEGQHKFDPYEDKEFIEQAAALCPWYILRYTMGQTMSDDEIIEHIKKAYKSGNKTKKYNDGQKIEMLGEKHGGGFSKETSGWQKGKIQKAGKTTVTLKFDGWHELRLKIDEFENILAGGTMRIVEGGQ